MSIDIYPVKFIGKQLLVLIAVLLFDWALLSFCYSFIAWEWTNILSFTFGRTMFAICAIFSICRVYQTVKDFCREWW